MSKMMRKHGKSTALMLVLGIIGALALLVAMTASSGVTEAQGGSPPTPTTPVTSVPPALLSAPQNFQSEVLYNSALLSWEAPATKPIGSVISGYQIDRDAWNVDAGNPINTNGDTTIMVEAHLTKRSDLGLAYSTTYTYRVRTEFTYTLTNTKEYGAWSRERSVTTASSGPRLEPLLAPPTMVRMLSADPTCDIMIVVSWSAPVDAGTAPTMDDNGVYVGPDYIGGNQAGKEEVGQPATIARYQVARMVNNSVWTEVAPDGLSYTDLNVAYGNTYQYRVRAQNSAGLYGPWGMVTEDLVEPDEPGRPVGLVINPVEANTVELEWLAPEDPGPAAVALAEARGEPTPLPLWRTSIDFLKEGDSRNLTYRIQRRVGDSGPWTTIASPVHRYGVDRSDRHTQGYKDDDAPSGLVNYRVAALVGGCNISPFSQKNAVTVTQRPLALGMITDLTLSNSLELTWTPAENATSHIAIVVNAVDDTDYCLSPTLASTASSYTCSGARAAAGTAYVGLVIAMNNAGLGSTVSNFPVRSIQ